MLLYFFRPVSRQRLVSHPFPRMLDRLLANSLPFYH